MASITKFIWRTATSGTPQRSVLGTILLKIFNDLDDEAEPEQVHP